VPGPILSAQLCGTALRLAAERVPVDVAVEELRCMANGRGDLLAEPAGLMIDAAPVRPVTAEYRAAVRLLSRPAPARTSLQAGSEMIGSAD
jgi:hypothetical protein